MSELYFPSLSPDEMSGDGPATTAELQGALCGLLCMDAQASRSNWYKSLFEELTPSDQEQLDLAQLFDETIQSLNSLDFDFQMALPEDSAPIASRLGAIADWCQGLIYGLGVSGLSDDTELSGDCQEYIADAIKISQISDEDLENSDADESNFEELVEYLRMGLFLLYGELQPVDPTEDSTEH